MAVKIRLFSNCISSDNKIYSSRFRDYSERKCDHFLENMDEEFQNCNPPINDVNACSLYIDNFLKNMQNKYFPIKTKTLSQKRLRAPWLISDIMRCIRKKHEWHRLAKQELIRFESYKRYSSALRS